MTERRIALIQRSGTYVGPSLTRRLGAAVEVVGEDEVPLAGPGSDLTASGILRRNPRVRDASSSARILVRIYAGLTRPTAASGPRSSQDRPRSAAGRG